MHKTILKLALILLATSSTLTFAANIENGKKIVKEKNCASCHGVDFNTTISGDYPKLAGQKEDYLYYALVAYTSKNDLFGRNNAIMAGQAAALSKNDMRDVAAYLASLPSTLILRK
jgi:cytochrome c553